MRKILYKLIDDINERLIEERKDNPYSDYIHIRFNVGNKIVNVAFDKRGCEVEIYNTRLDYFLDNISMKCESRVICWEDIEVEVEETDEWNEHGFRDAADYYNWRYC